MSEALMEPKGPTRPEFFMSAEPNPFRSTQEGRPCFDEVECVKLWIPGDKNSAPVQRVDDDAKTRWPKEYEAFKAGIDAPLVGTPLKEWGPISRSQALEFAHFHILTVEDLAGIHDGQVQNLPMGTRNLREQAKAYLDIAANGTAPIARMVGQIDDLTAENNRKDAIIEDLAKRLTALEGKGV